MPNAIVELVEREMDRFSDFWKANRLIFPAQDNLYPIPFFGDIRKAEALTLAFNPAWTEFNRNRYWIPGLDPRALTIRLLHYFDLPDPAPHEWFKYRTPGLERKNCSYETNAAHIDLLSYPTKLRKLLNPTQRRAIGRLIETESASLLSGLLDLATKAKAVVVVDYTFSMANGATATTFNFVSTHQKIRSMLRSRGIQLLR